VVAVRVRRGSPAVAFTLAILALLLPPDPVGAHPNASSGPLRAGVEATATVLLFADEGPTTGFEVTVPADVTLTGARADPHLPVVARRGGTAAFGGGRLLPGEFAQVRLTLVPTHGGAFALRVLAHLDGVAAPYAYPPVVLGAADSGGGPPPGELAGAGLLVAGLAVTMVALRRRRRPGRRRDEGRGTLGG